METKDIVQSTILQCKPLDAYTAWLDSTAHGDMTGGRAQIDPKIGGKFTTWDGYIEGKTLELDPKKYKIVQEWRSNEDNWPKDHFSKITVEFLPYKENKTKIEFRQTEIPEEYKTDVEQGWKDFYWKPMQKYFSKDK